MKSHTILFWSTFNPESDITFEKWRNRDVELSPFHELTLRTHALKADYTTLYTYQQGLQGKITVNDAADIFPAEQAYSALLNGHSIAHISDTVRLQAAADNGGIVIDMDAVILKSLPQYDGFFSSMPAKATGGFAPKWGTSHPPLFIHDGSWDGKALAAFPIKISEDMKPAIKSLSNKIRQTLLRPPGQDSKAWNYVIWALKDIMRWSKSPVLPPIACCPFSSWLRAGKCYSLESPTRLDGKTELFGYTLPSIQEVMEQSYIVQHFFESAFQKASPVPKNFWQSVADDCLIAREAQEVLGANWRCIIEEKG